jgi:ectoine hydroxylase-related dioxygenase (phytanoyl-CoA dioxygenase family)
LTSEQKQQFLEDDFLVYDCSVRAEELHALRHAFERVYENEEEVQPDHPRMIRRPHQYYYEPALMAAVANPTVLAIARAALDTEDFIYTGGYLARTRFTGIPEDGKDNGGGWHADMFLRPGSDYRRDDRVAVWIYLDYLSRDEGATQLLPGSSARIRENFINDRPPFEGLEAELASANRGEGAVYNEAPAGGGFSFKSFAGHTARHNLSGIPRRIITMDFAVRSSKQIDSTGGSCHFQRLSAEQQETARAALPEDARWVMPIGEFTDLFYPVEAT